MRSQLLLFKPLAAAQIALVCCAVNLCAQTAPTITNQPASQTNTAGANITFSVGVSGADPISYQWQFNGANLPNNIITTVAGGGTGGDGGAATNASLNLPDGVALDGAGDLFIADTGNNRIRKVDTNGIITTVAGTNGGGYSGDSGMATNAMLSSPKGVAVDSWGNLYIADSANDRIRMVNTNGVISTIAGTNGAGYSGDGLAATNANLSNPSGLAFDAFGNLYIADTGNARIRMVNTNGVISTFAGTNGAGYLGDGLAATNAKLNAPSGVAFDASGNLYIADSTNERIREVSTSGIITTFAGNGTAGLAGDGSAATIAELNGPTNVALDAQGNLYIADSLNDRIRVLQPNGIIATVAGNGTTNISGDGGVANNAGLDNPVGVALDTVGNLYIAQSVGARISEVHLGGFPTITISNVGALNAGNYSVVISNASGSVTSAIATLTVEAPPVITMQPVSQPAGIGTNAVFSTAVAGSGSFGFLWYFDGTNLLQSGASSTLTLLDVNTTNGGGYTVVATNAYGSVTSLVATLTVGVPPSVTSPCINTNELSGGNLSLQVSVSGNGPFSYQWQCNGVNLPNNIITTVAGSVLFSENPDKPAQFFGAGGQATNAGVKIPEGVATDSIGNFYFSDTGYNVICKVDTNGIISIVAGNGTNGFSGDNGPATNASLSHPGALAFDALGNLYFCDSNRVRWVGTNGVITTVAGGGNQIFNGQAGQTIAATSLFLEGSSGVAVDTSGNFYIVIPNDPAVAKVGTNGIASVVTRAAYYAPAGVEVDAAGSVYTADAAFGVITKVTTNGLISYAAGHLVFLGAAVFAGDGGPATNAVLRAPNDSLIDPTGNLYIADLDDFRVRKVDTNGIITTVAGMGAGSYTGDGGPATNAGLIPARLAMDPLGNLFIADYTDGAIREIHYAGLPTLTLNNLGINNTGNYTVVVSSPYGSVTNPVAMVTVTPGTPPQISGSGPDFGFAGNGFGFDLAGTNGQTIVVDASTDLVDWIPLFTNYTTSTNAVYFSDPAWTNYPMRFYRARLP